MKLKLFVFLFATMSYVNAFTQPAIKGQKTMGGNNDDEFYSMFLTGDGGMIIAGVSTSEPSGEKSDYNRGEEDFWIVKLDSQSKIQWDKTIGGNSYDFPTSIQQTSDGGYIIGGYSHSGISGEKTQDSRGGSDFWIVKLDASGNILWDKTIGGYKDDFLSSIRQTPDGGYILGGNSYSDISGEKTENSRGLQDYWIVKLDGSGNILWDKTFGGSSIDQLASLELTNDGGYITGGRSSSNVSGEKTENSRGGEDYWIVKLDSNGNKIWDKTFGGNSVDYLSSLQLTNNGGFIVAGGSFSNISGDKTQNSNGDYDYWVLKLTSNGNKIWDKTIGSSGFDWLNSVQQTLDGGYIMGGWSDGNISGNKSENSRGADDYWIVKLHATGNIQWDKTIGGDARDECIAVKEIVKNYYVLGGSSASHISGDKTQKSRGTDRTDYWIVLLNYKKTQSFSASSANDIQKQALKNNKDFYIYPSPAKDILHIQTTGKATIILTDQSGKTILTTRIDNKADIDISKLSAGLYYIKNIQTGQVQKVIITR